jgi:hypothetical protein
MRLVAVNSFSDHGISSRVFPAISSLGLVIRAVIERINAFHEIFRFFVPYPRRQPSALLVARPIPKPASTSDG